MAYNLNDNETDAVTKPAPRKGEGTMDEKELRRIMHGLIADAEQMCDGELSPKREEATDYFFGRPFGNEEEGRSQVVITEVRDVAHGTLPSLLRLFFGPERVVEFVPRTEAGVDVAKQATDFVQYLFAEENQGFLRTREVLLDGLVRKLGVFKWAYVAGTDKAMCDEGITREALVTIAARPDVTLTSVTEHEAEGTVDVEYTVKMPGRVRVWALPPEEFIYDREAWSVEEATLVAHRMQKTRGELIALGIKESVIDAHGGDDETLNANIERMGRRDELAVAHNPDSGKANEKMKYVESYVLLDCNGDGEAELRRVCTIGPEDFPVLNEPAEERPFAIFCPYPEPHTLTGQSQADLTMDLQKIKSSLVRGTLDSFSLSLFPRMAVVEGMVSIEDALNTEIGAIIRTKRQDAVQSFSHPFTGEKAMGILSYFDDVSESRTGRDKGSMGLDADALQSSTKQAVAAAVTASQEQIETIARIFAEQALKPLFRGMYRLIVKHTPDPRIAKLRGEYVPVNPASWEADMDVIVNVALGTSLTEQRITTLQGIAEAQKEILQLVGPDNPLVSIAQLRETYARMLEFSGFRDVSAFFKPVDPNWQPPAPQGPPPPTPEQVMAQAQIQMEQMKTQREFTIKEAELQLRREAQQSDYDLQVRKMANDFVLRRYQIDAQFKSAFTQADLQRDSDAEASAISLALDVRKQQHTEQQAAQQQDMAERDQAHQHAMDQAAQAQAAQQGAPSQQQQPTDGTETA